MQTILGGRLLQKFRIICLPVNVLCRVGVSVSLAIGRSLLRKKQLSWLLFNTVNPYLWQIELSHFNKRLMCCSNEKRCVGNREPNSTGSVKGTKIQLFFILGRNIGGKSIVFGVFAMSRDKCGGKRGI